MTVAEYVTSRRQQLGVTRYRLAQLVCQRLGQEPTRGRVTGYTAKIGRIETGLNKLGHGAARPFATALGQVIDDEPLRLLRLCGLLPAVEPLRLSLTDVVAADRRFTAHQRAQLAALVRSFGVDPNQPAP